jgi:RHS repeat-associated protein
VRTAYTYTPGPGRVSRQVTTGPGAVLLEDIAYTFDKMEVMLSSNNTAPDGVGLRQYNYDPLYQLTSLTSVENGNPVRRVYDYADDYNLSRFEEARSTLHYDDVGHPDRLTSLTPDGGVGVDLGYDGNGNLLSLPNQQFGYNAKNELLRFSRADGLTADYRYDHLGFRISKRVDDGQGTVQTTLFVGNQVEINSQTGTTHFVRLGAMRVAALQGGTTNFIHENGMGSTSFVTDADGLRIGQLDQLPFGNVASSSGSVEFRTFALHPVDEESGLVYMHRRYYSPALGRFLTPDLMAIYQPDTFLHTPQSLHLYAYVANDPLNKTDPTGLSFMSFLGGVVGVIVGVAIGIAIVAAVVATGGIAGVLLGIGLALLASAAVMGVSYAIASNADPNSLGGQFMRGFMIGFNAGMNAVLATAIFGPFIGVALGVVNFLAVFDGVAQNSVYQGILGWSSWLMPMSWGVTGVGLLFFIINLAVAGVTGNDNAGTKIDKLSFDWKTGSFVMLGGAITGPTAFNMGNFSFLNPTYVDGSSFDRTYENVLRHETGHTLSNAAFGSAYHLIGAIDENVIQDNGMNAYSELIAEGHVPGTGRPTHPMWS